jgi:hypothetical protein
MSPSAVRERRSGARLLPVALAGVLVVLVVVGAVRFKSRPPSRGDVPHTGETLPEEQGPASPRADVGSGSRRHVALAPLPDIGAASPSLDEMQPTKTTAVEHRDKSVAELKASGPASRTIAESAAKVAKGWSEKMPKIGVDVQVGPVECFRKGCFMTVVHATDDDVERATQAITRTGEFHGWQSGKMRSGPIPRPDGKVEATWFLFPPQDGKEPMAATLPPDNLDELPQRPAR